MASMKDIAEICGVSIATVSKAMNNHSDISEETKQHIRQVADEIGYFPNSAARALKTNRTYNIGVLYQDDSHVGLTHEYFAGVLESFKAEAESKGYDITFINHNVSDKNMSYYEHCRYRGVDGVVVACIDFADPEVVALVNSSIPTVTIDHVFGNCSSVLSDNEKGMRDLVHYVYSLGHRKIAYIYGDSDSAVTKARVRGFMDAMKSLGLEVPDEYLMECDYRNAQIAALRTRQILRMKERPTCVLYPDDYTCLGGIGELKGQGISVPGELSVAGFDGGFVSEIVEPSLTTIKQDTEMVGKTAAVYLINSIERMQQQGAQSGETTVQRAVIDSILVRGKSVAKIME